MWLSMEHSYTHVGWDMSVHVALHIYTCCLCDYLSLNVSCTFEFRKGANVY